MQSIDKHNFQVYLCYSGDMVINIHVNRFLLIKIKLKLISLLN